MPRYISFLRGVNVGGNNKVSMAELKKLLAANGYRDVVTYINSGNILFTSDSTDCAVLQRHHEALIAEHFGLAITLAIVPGDTLLSAVKHAPEWWNRDADTKHNAIFVIPPATAASVTEAIGPAKPEYEQVAAHGQVIYWSAPIATFSRTRWSKVVSTSVYGSITIRNANTVLKLAQLLSAGTEAPEAGAAP